MCKRRPKSESNPVLMAHCAHSIVKASGYFPLTQDWMLDCWAGLLLSPRKGQVVLRSAFSSLNSRQINQSATQLAPAELRHARQSPPADEASDNPSTPSPPFLPQCLPRHPSLSLA